MFCGTNLVAMFYSYNANGMSVRDARIRFYLLLIAGVIELFENKPSPLNNLSTTFFEFYMSQDVWALVGREMNLLAPTNAKVTS